jgi:hypothetical protein
MVFMENGSDVTPSIIILVYAVNLGSDIRSFGVTISLNCAEMTLASSYPIVNENIDQILPKIASRIVSNNWLVYWFAIIRESLYFLASERIVANESVAKF